MTLKQAIFDLSKTNINDTNDWYDWREINEEKLPSGIKLPNGNQFIKNIALKHELNRLWKKAKDQDLKTKLIRYYICTWGGINTNKEKTLFEYSSFPADDLILKGKQGIASWSKAICIHDPYKYAIFDARVSISLNSLQITNNTEEKFLYPILPSRNKTINDGNRIVKEMAKKENWIEADQYTFYRKYLQLLLEIANELETEIAAIEMLLFTKAEELVKLAL